MSFIDKFTISHLDALKEAGNIGAGHAATSLSHLLDRKINMHVPSVKLASFDEMMDIAGDSDRKVVAVFSRIHGEAPGNMFFVLPPEQASRYIKIMTGNNDFQLDKPPLDEIGLSALHELGNILSGSYISSLADFTNLDLYITVPALTIDMFGAVMSHGLLEISQVSDYGIVIETTVAEASATGQITGHFFLLPDPESYHRIFLALGVESDE
ncbi:chemotaxis protein CheC [Thalassobacillus pellis]|uniref:chemotaxis protein CheC n=1 Tax=Thalassobacillus pellis TaxID=748008 RepID=UPI00195FF815|nr:chemotaxis protein CheC [Thalassobacillus pellis]MBM7552727.1 chemotaxis protein CheC [Thalassobacillus pellis]